MNLEFDFGSVNNYKSKSQIARVLTEKWVLENSYCPGCGSDYLSEFENNRPVADFYCKFCHEEFELKSKCRKFSGIVSDGAYTKMMERICSDNNPNFFFLHYSRSFTVSDFFLIPKQFFIPEMIIQRKPLGEKARRGGWIGCNIDISKVSDIGKIFLVKDSEIIDREIVKETFKRVLFLRDTPQLKGWLLDIFNCLDEINRVVFTLEDIYKFENRLKLKYPGNSFIKDKIRQQLQVLRDKNIIEFLGRGKYRKLYN